MGHHRLPCGLRLVKGLHVFLNFIFLLAGLALIGLGVFVLVTNGTVVTTPLTSMKSVVIAMMAVGGGIVFLSFLGCCGACVESRAVLGIYAFLVFLIIVGEITVGALALTNKGQYLMNEITDKTWGSLDANSRIAIESDLKCCGWNNPLDQPAGPDCTPVPKYSTGCESAVWNFFQTSFLIAGASILAMGAVQVIGFIFAVCLGCGIGRANERERDRLLNESREAAQLPYASYNAPVHGYGYQPVVRR